MIGDQGEGWKRGKGFINKEDDSFGVCHTNERKLYYFAVLVLLKDSLQQVFFPHPALLYQGKSVHFINTYSPSANISKGDGLVTARDTCFVSICIYHDWKHILREMYIFDYDRFLLLLVSLQQLQKIVFLYPYPTRGNGEANFYGDHMKTTAAWASWQNGLSHLVGKLTHTVGYSYYLWISLTSKNTCDIRSFQ